MSFAAPVPSVSPALDAPFTPRTVRDDVGAVPAAIASEWFKLVSLRSNRVIFLLNMLTGFLVAMLVARFVTGETLYVSDVMFYWTFLTAIVASICGVMIFTSEVQHGTLAVTMAAQPTRWVVASGKLVVAVGFGLALGATGLLAGFTGGLAGGLNMGDTSGLAGSVGWALMYTTLSGLLGLGIGLIVRNAALAIGGLLVWGIIIEGVIDLFLPVRYSRFLPYLAGDRMLSVRADFDPENMSSLALSSAEGALVFGGYAALAMAIGMLLLYRRDVE